MNTSQAHSGYHNRSVDNQIVKKYILLSLNTIYVELFELTLSFVDTDIKHLLDTQNTNTLVHEQNNSNLKTLIDEDLDNPQNSYTLATLLTYDACTEVLKLDDLKDAKTTCHPIPHTWNIKTFLDSTL